MVEEARDRSMIIKFEYRSINGMGRGDRAGQEGEDQVEEIVVLIMVLIVNVRTCGGRRRSLEGRDRSTSIKFECYSMQLSNAAK